MVFINICDKKKTKIAEIYTKKTVRTGYLHSSILLMLAACIDAATIFLTIVNNLVIINESCKTLIFFHLFITHKATVVKFFT